MIKLRGGVLNNEKQGAEGNIWTQEGGSGGRLEKTV
jgi:hypothetical protein